MKHKLAVIGYGGMGAWHANNVRSRIDSFDVKGVYDIRGELKEKAENENMYFYGSAEELLRDKEVDIVVVAVPNNFHKDYVLKGLIAGKNVVCEKPVTMNVAELEEIIEVSQKAGRLFSIHHNRRWDKDYVTVKSILSAATAGTPYFIESKVQGSRGAMYGWRGHKINGGGMLYDWGAHLIDQLLMLIDSDVVSVDAHLLSLYSDEVDDNIKIMLRFENGVSAICEMSTNCLIKQPRWHISCTEGTIVVESFGCTGRIVKLKEDAQMEWTDDIIYTEAGPTRTMAPRPSYTTKELALPEVESDWCDYYKNIAAVIDGNDELIVTPHQALRTMKVIELAFLAEKEGHGFKCRI